MIGRPRMTHDPGGQCLRGPGPRLDRADEPSTTVDAKIQAAPPQTPRTMEPSPEPLRRLRAAILGPATRVGSLILLRQPPPGRINLVSPERAQPDRQPRRSTKDRPAAAAAVPELA